MKRPYPPESLVFSESESIDFMPAPELEQWILETFISEDGELYNEDHRHISPWSTDLFKVLWASSAFIKADRMVLGQCEKVMFNQGGWKKARQEQQMRDWYGFVPQYLITIDATYCEQANDRDFCRLIEHELYHIGVERDEDGEVIYSDHTGLPKHYLAGHDVEVFFGEIRQHGVDSSVQRLLDIAKNAPFASETNIAACCGNCVVG